MSRSTPGREMFEARRRGTSWRSRATDRSSEPETVSSSAASPPNMCVTSVRWSRDASGAVVTVLPSRITVATSARPNSSSRWWVTQISATPRSWRLRMWSKSNDFSCSSNPDVGSSRIRIFGLAASALTISTARFVSAPNSPTGRPSSAAEMPNSAARVATRRAIWRRLTRSEPRPSRAVSFPRKMFSSTVRSATVDSSWWIVTIPSRCASFGWSIETRSPSTSIVPPSGRTIPDSTLRSVDLPAPLPPRRAWISPRLTVRLTRSSACTPR